MLRIMGAVTSGVLFGAGLVVSGMVDPMRVLGFLDVAGVWDPTLAFVMGGALMVTTPLFWVAIRRGAPLADTKFHLPTLRSLDRRLLAGAAIFGMGWGLVGYCPGPALAGIGMMWHELIWFLPFFALGSWLAGRTVN